MEYKIDEVKVAGNSCINCGQQANVKRIDGHYIMHEIEHVLHFERGILYTIRELLVRPGENIRHFISEDRSRLVKPVIFIIITSLAYSLITHFFHIEDGYTKLEETKGVTAGIIFKWIQDHYGYGNILMGAFVAFWSRLFFKKYDYNFFEILILLCFVMGMGMMLFAVVALIQGFIHKNLMQIVFFLKSYIVIGQLEVFLDKEKAISYVKAFAAYILGMITFSLSVMYNFFKKG